MWFSFLYSVALRTPLLVQEQPIMVALIAMELQVCKKEKRRLNSYTFLFIFVHIMHFSPKCCVSFRKKKRKSTIVALHRNRSSTSKLLIKIELKWCWFFLGGACGFGEYGRTVNDGNVAGVSRLYRNGTGCGACYQVCLNWISMW